MKQENLALRVHNQISLVRFCRPSWVGLATLPWAENKVPWLMVAVHVLWALESVSSRGVGADTASCPNTTQGIPAGS